MKLPKPFKHYQPLFRVSEVADYTRQHPITIKKWIKAGKLKFIRPGRAYLIPASEVDRLLEAVIQPTEAK